MGIRGSGGRSESLGDKQAAVEDGDHTLVPGLWGCLFGLCPEHSPSLISKAWHLLTVKAEA